MAAPDSWLEVFRKDIGHSMATGTRLQHPKRLEQSRADTVPSEVVVGETEKTLNEHSLRTSRANYSATRTSVWIA